MVDRSGPLFLARVTFLFWLLCVAYACWAAIHGQGRGARLFFLLPGFQMYVVCLAYSSAWRATVPSQSFYRGHLLAGLACVAVYVTLAITGDVFGETVFLLPVTLWSTLVCYHSWRRLQSLKRDALGAKCVARASD